MKLREFMRSCMVNNRTFFKDNIFISQKLQFLTVPYQTKESLGNRDFFTSFCWTFYVPEPPGNSKTSKSQVSLFYICPVLHVIFLRRFDESRRLRDNTKTHIYRQENLKFTQKSRTVSFLSFWHWSDFDLQSKMCAKTQY